MIRDAAENASSELSGVNMDDEAAQLIEYQQAYQASARVLQTARELFDNVRKSMNIKEFFENKKNKNYIS